MIQIFQFQYLTTNLTPIFPYYYVHSKLMTYLVLVLITVLIRTLGISHREGSIFLNFLSESNFYILIILQ